MLSSKPESNGKNRDNFLTDYKDCTMHQVHRAKQQPWKWCQEQWSTFWPTTRIAPQNPIMLNTQLRPNDQLIHSLQHTKKDQKHKQETSGQVTGQQNEAKSTVTLKYSDQFTGWYNQAR